jgi:hypothetical protein
LPNGVIVPEPVFDRQEIQKCRPPMLRTHWMRGLRCFKAADVIDLPHWRKHDAA